MKFLNILTKRRLLVAGSILLTTFLFCFSAFALNVNRSPLSIYEKSDNVIVDDSESLEEKDTIIPNIKFSQPGDFITYKLTLNNSDNSKYKITNISDNNTNENITVSYSYDNTTSVSDKNIYVTLTYAQELTDDLSLTDFEVTIEYEETTDANDEKDLPIPNTSGIEAPDTGNQTFSQTFSTKDSNHIIPNILLGVLICAMASIFYLLFRQTRRSKDFKLGEISRSRQIFHNFISLIITGLIITSGAISITRATSSNNLKLHFDLSKVELSTDSISKRTVNFINNAPNVVANIQETIKTCDLEPDEISCEITLPSFTVKQGHEILGWNTDKNAKVALYQPGETVSFSTNTTLYTITRGEFSASFVNQHEAHFNISHESDSCYVYNSTSNCQVTTPTASKRSTNDEPEFLGWSTDSTSTTPEIASGNLASISENTAFYSIASIPPTIISVQFINQDPNGISISQESTTCTVPENKTDCSIILPTIATNSGHNALGWSKYSNLTTATYSAGQAVTVSSSTTFYTISYKTLTATFNNLHTNYFSISSSSATCPVYNGAISGCVVVAPTITKLTDDELTTFLGWNINQNTNIDTETGTSILIHDNSTYYSVAKIPTNTTYSLTFTNDMWESQNLEPLSYFSSIENCNRSSTETSQCIEVVKTCTLYTWESSCTITAPEFNTASGWNAYGYDTKRPGVFRNPSDKTDNFAEIGKNIIVTANNHNRKYYNLIRRQDYITATFVNQHTSYLDSSSSSETCYIYNNNKACEITTPNLTLKQTNNNVTKLTWSKSSSRYQNEVNAGQTTSISENITFYSAATGFEYTITFDKNVDFEGSKPNGNWYEQNNIAADSLSLYSTKCNVTPSGCQLTSVPRIYSTGNTPAGFSISQYGDISLTNLFNYNFIADTTVYARVFNWGNIQTSYSKTTKIYNGNSTTEYYQIDFENGLDGELVSHYSNYLENVFQNVPQLHILHGKMRFLTRDTYAAYHKNHPNSLMLTYSYGLFAPIDAKPSYSNSADSYTETAFLHELGHAMDSAWSDLYGKRISYQTDFKELYNEYTEEYVTARDENGNPSSIATGAPLRLYSYNNQDEFFADSFAVWYGNKSGVGSASSFGQISDAISQLLDSYLCNTEYTKIPYISSSPVCGNAQTIPFERPN